uniref:Prolactin receptor n=4 Tax=Nothobranchius pienaari TaxID=704102 RepID=A0A1A8MMB1_9TELE
MRKAEGGISLRLLLLFMLHATGTSYSPPGKPTLTRCRSPEKETFTCWWEPGSDGGLPTKYALYYRKENSDKVFECPDYRSAGENSCFFNKNDTSVWVNYNITVVATNALGRTFSDPVDIDVVYIVKPNPPENLALTVLWDQTWPYLHVSWESPQKADTRSGWITLIYELRIKLEDEDEWEEHPAGQQKTFNIFSLCSGGKYLVQVRCKPDHGFWSEWSSSQYVKVPEYFNREKSMWVLAVIFSAFALFIITWLIHMNCHNLKQCILPSVPGPKIKGFDEQLLKDGKSMDAFSSLVGANFPPTTTNYEDLLVEYLEVFVPEERELMLEETKELHNGSLKFENSTSDCDSGRGSCDSHTLLIDKSEEEKGQQPDQQSSEIKMDGKGQDEEDKYLTCSPENVDSPQLSSEKVKTWPSSFSPLPEYSPIPLQQPNSHETSKQPCLSDSLFAAGPLPSHFPHQGHNTKDEIGSSYWQFGISNKQLHLLHQQMEAHQQLQAHKNASVSNIGHLQLPSVRFTEYVEVQRVSDQNMVILHPVPSHPETSYPDWHQTEEYSKVKCVDNDNGLLLLQREGVEEGMDMCSYEELPESDPSKTTNTAFTSPCSQPAPSVQDERVVGGYVDTSVFTLPTY